METEINYMSTYSIKDLEHLSGIKAHTLRIWEQRYNLIHPKRTPTNIRYYESSDLKLILNIARLREHGFKISKIAAMSKEAMNLQIRELDIQDPEGPENYIHHLTNAMLDLDEGLFEHTLSTCILQLGLESTMKDIIHPFLLRIGYLWQTEAINPAQEHFISCLLRQKLIVAIDGQQSNFDSNAKRYMLYLPEGELHEITLLYASYILKKHNNHVIYLGQNLPFTDVKGAYKIYQPDYVLSISTTSPQKALIQKYVNSLSKSFPKATILLSGFGILNATLSIPFNVKILKQINDLHQYMTPEQVSISSSD